MHDSLSEHVWVCLHIGMHLEVYFPCLYIYGLFEYQTTIVILCKSLSNSSKEIENVFKL